MTLATRITSAFDKIAAKAPQAVQTATIRKTTITGGGPSDPDGGTATNTDYTARVAVLHIQRHRVGQETAGGTAIQATDLQVVVEHFDAEIALGDKIIVDRGTLSVIDPGKIAPGGTTLAWDCVARG